MFRSVTSKATLLAIVTCSLTAIPRPAAACNDSIGDTWHLECVTATWVQRGGWRLRNVCNTKLELVWCVRGSKHNECRPRPYWWTSQWSAEPGKTWYVPSQGGYEIEYNACQYKFWK